MRADNAEDLSSHYIYSEDMTNLDKALHLSTDFSSIPH